MASGQDLRRRVLEASLALIGEGGLDRFSMREVARKAGVSHQAPYHHFGDREAILAALATEGFAKFLDEMEQAAAGAGADPARAVEAMGRAYVGFALKHPAYFQVMFRADAVSLDKHPEARRLEGEAFDRLIQVIDRAFANEPEAARRRIAIACWALAHGLATLLLEGSLARKTGVPKAKQKQLADEVVGIFGALIRRGLAR